MIAIPSHRAGNTRGGPVSGCIRASTPVDFKSDLIELWLQGAAAAQLVLTYSTDGPSDGFCGGSSMKCTARRDDTSAFSPPSIMRQR